ncbi:hypothetical protein F4680DRAFT_417935 [Xylaria scruposa]|nr:hypothetical protein F4680DRAFT_417935 [Xylaria scruposa]
MLADPIRRLIIILHRFKSNTIVRVQQQTRALNSKTFCCSDSSSNCQRSLVHNYRAYCYRYSYQQRPLNLFQTTAERRDTQIVVDKQLLAHRRHSHTLRSTPTMSSPAFRSLFARLSLTSPHMTRATFLSSSPAIPSIISPAAPSSSSSATLQCHHHQQQQQSRSFHITSAHAKSVVPSKHGKKQSSKGRKGKKGKGGEGPDPRILNLKAAMPRAVPAPLRFARNRALRHWTIHRAWLLYQRQQRERQAHELERMYQSMHNACEELRRTSGPGTREDGYLYRVAMEKHGVYGHNAVPIEYARPQTETPARQVWNHEWTR